MNRFWQWVKNEGYEERTLYMDGVIAETSWFGDEVTPALFKDELFSGSGPITLHLNSPGGDCIAASQIYTMLMDYPYDITVRIDGLAASAASVVAMAGTKVCMSPTSMMMIHNPFTSAMGDTEEMRRAIQLLDEVKESIINAYEIKTGCSRMELSALMDEETWMNPLKAKELGFCDEILYTDNPEESILTQASFSYGRKAAICGLMNRLIESLPPVYIPKSPEIMDKVKEPEPEPASQTEPERRQAPEEQPVSKPMTTQKSNDNRVKATDLEKRLSLLR